MATDAVETLESGMLILAPLMEHHGFKRSETGRSKGSGGGSAFASWIRGDRRLELHFRYSLGLVTYSVGPVSLSHEDYMWAHTGKRWATQYPGFSDDPVDAFRDLRADLEKNASSFLSGPDDHFFREVRRAANLREGSPRLA